MKQLFWLLLVMLSSQALSFAQTAVPETGDAKIIQQSQSTVDTSSPAQNSIREVKLSAGTLIEVEVAYTVNSLGHEARRADQFSRFGSDCD